MDLKINELVPKMMTAAEQSFGQDWRKVKSFVRIEFNAIARKIKEIGTAVLAQDNLIDLERGKILLENQKILAAQTIAAAAGMLLAAVQNAINAVFDQIRQFVNGKVGIALI